MPQEIKNINIADLVLWTENPRDPIDPYATDQDIVNRAIIDEGAKWNLKSLAKAMGLYYDFSELPTIVYHNERPIVYDGNRRMILAKIQHHLVDIGDYSISLPDIPATIPCNVCSEDIALQNIYRKHAESGSWSILERDIFLHKFMKQPKSIFLLFDENTNHYISNHPALNQRFVKDEIFTDKGLQELGFTFRDGQMFSTHTQDEALLILNDIHDKVKNKIISTRNNRGKTLDALDSRTCEIIQKNQDNPPLPFSSSSQNSTPLVPNDKKPRKTKRVKSSSYPLFGQTLTLAPGDINNLYSDILEIYHNYEKNSTRFTMSFFSIIRMSLRLLCESAMKDYHMTDIKIYIKRFFPEAKKLLSPDIKTYLSNYNITVETLPQLLHIGAHDYTATRDREQAIGISIIVGAMLSLSHGKQA